MAEAEKKPSTDEIFQGLTGTQKCAILMMLIGEDEAAEIMGNLSPKEVQVLGSACLVKGGGGFVKSGVTTSASTQFGAGFLVLLTDLGAVLEVDGWSGSTTVSASAACFGGRPRLGRSAATASFLIWAGLQSDQALHSFLTTPSLLSPALISRVDLVGLLTTLKGPL